MLLPTAALVLRLGFLMVLVPRDGHGFRLDRACDGHGYLGQSGSEKPHEVIVGHLGCKTSGCCSGTVLRVGIGASIQESADNLAVSVAHVEQCPPQRGVTKPVAGIHVRPGLDEHRGYVCMLLLGREVQQGETFPVCVIHLVAVFLEIGSHVSGPAFQDRTQQRRPSCPAR